MADQASKFEGAIKAGTGSVLASWYLFNPNGPTAYAFGYLEEGDNMRFFCRWMHFSGGEIYILDDVSTREAVSANFAELTMNALIGVTNQMAISGGKSPGPGIGILPSFVKTNGNAEIDKCLKYLVSCGGAVYSTDWGRELYYLKKYGSDLFGRVGEETRETYEQLLKESEVDPTIDKELLKLTLYRHAHISSFQNWQPGAYRSKHFSEAAFDEWWSVISSPAFVCEALGAFAHAWVGSIQLVEGGEFLKTMREEGRFMPFDELVRFFDQFHLPILPQRPVSERASGPGPAQARSSQSRDEADKDFREGFEAYKASRFSDAERLYSQAAEAGVAGAQYNLAQMYYRGEGVAQDLTKAAHWFEQAAMQAIPEAQHNIGLAYDEGYGVEVDKIRAAFWYEHASAHGMLNSMQNLALMYANGDGVPKSYDKAFPLFLKAAQEGLPDAQQSTAAFYANGWGTPPDLVEALKWAEILLLRGFDVPFKEALMGRMSEQEAADANRLAKQWLQEFEGSGRTQS